MTAESAFSDGARAAHDFSRAPPVSLNAACARLGDSNVLCCNESNLSVLARKVEVALCASFHARTITVSQLYHSVHKEHISRSAAKAAHDDMTDGCNSYARVAHRVPHCCDLQHLSRFQRLTRTATVRVT